MNTHKFLHITFMGIIFICCFCWLVPNKIEIKVTHEWSAYNHLKIDQSHSGNIGGY